MGNLILDKGKWYVVGSDGQRQEVSDAEAMQILRSMEGAGTNAPSQSKPGMANAYEVYKKGKGVYDAANQISSMMGSGSQVPAATGSEFIGPMQPGSGLGPTGGMASYGAPIASAASAAGGAYLAYDLGKDIHQNKIKKTGRGYARGAGQGAASGALIGTAIMPGVGTLIGAGVGALAGGIGVAAGHEGTKEAQKRKWGELAEKGILVPEGLSTADQKSAGKTAKNWSFEAARQKLLSGENPDEFVGVLGNFETFGNDWLGKYSDDQRRAFAKRAAAEGLYNSKKGDIFISDADKAKKIMDEVLGGTSPIVTQPVTNLPGTIGKEGLNELGAVAGVPTAIVAPNAKGVSLLPTTIPGASQSGAMWGAPTVTDARIPGMLSQLQSYKTSRGDSVVADAGSIKRWRESRGR